MRHSSGHILSGNPWDLPILFKGIDLDEELGLVVSRGSRFELFWVLSGSTQVCCLMVDERQLAAVAEWCRCQGLVARECPERFSVQPEPAKGGYSNVARSVGATCEPAHRRLMVARDAASADLAVALRLDDHAFALLLGYPSCCIDFYLKWFPQRFASGNDYVAPSITELGKYSYLNNSLLRYFGLNLISHFPCSLTCGQTRAASKRKFDALRMHCTELARAVERHLRSMVLYTEEAGIAYATEYVTTGRAVTVRHSYAIPGTALDELLGASNKVVVESFDSFIIGGRRFSGDSRVAFFQ